MGAKNTVNTHDGKATSRVSLMSKWLIFTCVSCAWSCLIYGYDTSSFNGMQSLPSFTREFGVLNPATGAYALSDRVSSMMNSIAYIGKGIGAYCGAPIVERWGHRWGIFTLCAVSIVGIVIQMTSYSVGQFVVSRVIIFASIGLIETCICAYVAECVPPSVRGMMVALIQVMQSPGGLIAAGVNRAISTNNTYRMWLLTSGLQFIWPIMVLIVLPFLPNSPRWLLSKGRREEAEDTLRKLRSDRVTEADMQEEFNMFEEELAKRNEVKATWLDLFRGTNLRRTNIVAGVLTLQQTMGSTFVSSYAVPFWIKAGLGANSFSYSIGLSSAGFVGVLIGQQCYDRIGRRPILMFGSIGLFCTMIIVGVVGVTPNPYEHTKGLLLVGVVITYAPIYVSTWGAVPYIIASEVGTGALREKTLAFGMVINVVWQFTTTYVTPYLLTAIGAKLGFIFAAVCLIGFVFVFFMVPETKNRSLEELEIMFQERIPTRKFKRHVVELPAEAVNGVHVKAGSEDDEKIV